MAVAVQHPSQTKPTPRGSVDTLNPHPREYLELVTNVMSYQYPPPQNGEDMDLPHPGYLSSYPTPSTSSLEGMNETDHNRLGSMADKKPGRNKLGYHRTSVACTHCRRRKIRCQPQAADMQGRCSNCIRLKKDCSFYSVGQEPPAGTGQKAGARPSVGPKIASASSSPAIATGHPPEISTHAPYPQLATMSSMQNMGPPSLKPEAYPADPKVSSNASGGRVFDYAPAVANWIPPDTSPNSAKAPGDLSVSWKSYAHESPVTPAFSPYPTHPSSAAATWPPPVSGDGVAATSRPEEQVAWSNYSAPPGRSMSYGGEQGYTPASQVGGGPGRAGAAAAYDRRSSAAPDMYPPPITTTSLANMEASIPGTAMDPHASLSAGAVTTPSGYGGGWQQYPFSKAGGDTYESWYGSAAAAGDHQPQTGYYAGR